MIVAGNVLPQSRIYDTLPLLLHHIPHTASTYGANCVGLTIIADLRHATRSTLHLVTDIGTLTLSTEVAVGECSGLCSVTISHIGRVERAVPRRGTIVVSLGLVTSKMLPTRG